MSEQEFEEQPEGQSAEAVAAGPVDPATTKHWYIIHS